jgi:hypothetical protein
MVFGLGKQRLYSFFENFNFGKFYLVNSKVLGKQLLRPASPVPPPLNIIIIFYVFHSCFFWEHDVWEEPGYIDK